MTSVLTKKIHDRLMVFWHHVQMVFHRPYGSKKMTDQIIEDRNSPLKYGRGINNVFRYCLKVSSWSCPLIISRVTNKRGIRHECRNLAHTIPSKAQELGFIPCDFDNVTKLTCDIGSYNFLSLILTYEQVSP